MHGAFHEELAQKKLLIVEYGDLAATPTKTQLAREIVAPQAAGAPRHAAAQVPRRREGGRDRRAAACRSTAASATRKDFGAEKLLRDALVMPIYEGTSQIQALMAMKDTLGGILKNPQRFVRRGAQARWRALSARDRARARAWRASRRCRSRRSST